MKPRKFTAVNTKPCKSPDCPNFCAFPNVYCGRCAGYEHEMPAEERKQLIKGYPGDKEKES